MGKRIAIAENYISNMKWYDLGLFKVTMFIFTLLVAKYFNILLQAEWYWYVSLLAILVPRQWYIAFIKK